jgi:UPF0271 protein
MLVSAIDHPPQTLAPFHIDLNADLGEGAQHDAEILSFVSSANIACGGHAGDERSMEVALDLAKQRHVSVGAHPSFMDRVNFGRTNMHPPLEELYRDLCTQVLTLMQIAQKQGLNLAHLKPHGALYNQAAKDHALGAVLIRVIQHCDPQLRLVGLAGSALIKQAKEAGMTVYEEAFADRRYNDDASLVARNLPDACIDDSDEALTQSLLLIEKSQIATLNGNTISARADTLCVHGDGHHALQLIEKIHRELTKRGIQITSKNIE